MSGEWIWAIPGGAALFLWLALLRLAFWKGYARGARQSEYQTGGRADLTKLKEVGEWTRTDSKPTL